MLTWEEAYTVTDCPRITSELHSTFSSLTSGSSSSSVGGSFSGGVTAVTMGGATTSQGLTTTIVVVTQSGFSSFSNTFSNANANVYSSFSQSGITTFGLGGQQTASLTSSSSNFSFAVLNGNSTASSASTSVILVGTTVTSGSTSSRNATSQFAGTTGAGTTSGSTATVNSSTSSSSGSLTAASYGTVSTTRTEVGAKTTVTTETQGYYSGGFTTEQTYTNLTLTSGSFTKSLITTTSTTQTVTALTSTQRVAVAQSSELLYSYASISTTGSTMQALSDGISSASFTYKITAISTDVTLSVVSRATLTISFNNSSSYTLTINQITDAGTYEQTILAYPGGFANSTETVEGYIESLTDTTLAFTSGTSFSQTAFVTGSETVTTVFTTTSSSVTFIGSEPDSFKYSANSTYLTTLSTSYVLPRASAGNIQFTTSSSSLSSRNSSSTSNNNVTASTTATTISNALTSHGMSYYHRFGTSRGGLMAMYEPQHIDAVRQTPNIDYSDPAYEQIGPGTINQVPYNAWSEVQRNVTAPMPGLQVSYSGDTTWRVSMDRSGGVSYTSSSESTTSGSSSFTIGGSGARDETGYIPGGPQGGFNKVPGEVKKIIDNRFGYWRHTILNSSGGNSTQTSSGSSPTVSTLAESILYNTESEYGGGFTVSDSTIGTFGVPGVERVERVYIPNYLS